MSERQKRILLADLYGDLEGGEAMEFWLTYRGPLRATQRDPQPDSQIKAKHWKLKHSMRKQLHGQLKAIWDTHDVLIKKQSDPASVLNRAKLANEFKLPPWSFVPLVTCDLQVICGLEIVLLRLDHPGNSIWSGDIDNRVKTLIDALEVPDANSGYAELPVENGYEPLFCLLQSDKLLTSVSVETGKLLKAPAGVDQSYAEVSFKVRIKGDYILDTTAPSYR